MNHTLALAVFFIASSVAQAQTAAQAPVTSAYRCGNTYSQTPCPNGKLIDAQDQRSQEQQAQTKAAGQRDQRVADAMEKDRLKREAEQARNAQTVTDKAQAKPKAEKTKTIRQVRVLKSKQANTDKQTANPSSTKKKKS